MTSYLPGHGCTRLAAALAALMAAAFVLAASTGAVRMYTPVPFWDMWGATLYFYMAINDGASWLWWAQHNEHRIVLSRLLFWLDYELFGGLSVFLLLMNYIIVALAIWLFWCISRDRLSSLPNRRALFFFTTCFLTAWLYQWMQHENLEWAFQRQFFLAQLLPLCAFYWLHKSASNAKVHGFFLVACLLGVASAGTVANGILALSLMTAYAIITRMRLWQLLTLALLSIATLALYFHDYQSPAYQGWITDALLRQPLQVAHFVLLYPGTSFFNLLGRGDIGGVAAVVSSLFMAAIALLFLVHGVKNPRQHTLVLALVFGIVYLAGTALGTAAGRVSFGVLQTVSFRYTTPALMVWACVLLLLLPSLWHQSQRYPRQGMAVMVVILGLMANSQWQAIKPQHQLVFDRELAGLALTLGIEDETQILNIFEMTPGLIRTVESAEKYELGMFAIPPWRGLKSAMGETLGKDGLPQCAGHVDIVSTIAPEEDYIAVVG